MLIANAKELTWRRITEEEWRELEKQGWRIVDAAWLTWMEGKVRKSDLWKKFDADSNEYLGRVILWFQEVAEEAARGEA